jgi:3-methyladenine DNA glycosylase AlkD
VKKIYYVILQLFYAALLFSAEQPGVSVGIRYFDKQLYYPQQGHILVQVTVTNNSSQTYSFRLSDDRAFSLDFDVRTPANRQIEAADVLVRKRSRQQQVFFREISLEPGESLSFTEDLRDWRLLDKAGSYIVQARFYPELFKPPAPDADESSLFVSLSGSPVRNESLTQNAIESNRLNLHIRAPAIINDEGVPVALDEVTQAVYFREAMPPDEVVTWTLQSRQKSQWEKFFLYLNIEQMLLRDASRSRMWRAESEEGRRRMLAKYREDLRSQIIDGDISAIPSKFTIERTTYNEDEGTVSVLERFKTGDYTERKRYTYYLRRDDDIWTIIDYVVQNLGTE